MVIEQKRLYDALSYLEKRIELFKSDCVLFDNTLDSYRLLQQEVRVICELQDEIRLISSNCFIVCPSVTFGKRFRKVSEYNSKMDLFDAVNKFRDLNSQLLF